MVVIMLEIYFFDVPVYRLPESRYYDEMNAYIERTMYPGPPEHDALTRSFHERYPDRKLHFREHLRDVFGGAWTFNEIVGWIRLHFLGTQIRGEYWATKSKRVVRTRRKIFEFQTHKLAPEIDVPEEASNTDVFQLVVEYVSECSKELKDRFVDLELLMMLGPHVDWKGLLTRSS
jgi:hypothetical protein